MVSRAVVETFLGALILAFGACGIVINVTAVVILMRRYTSPTAAMKRHLVAQGKESLNFSQFRIYYAKKRKRSSVFHQLLKLLSIYDILVCICACLAYGFPNVWATYQHQVMPKISVWLSPIIHIALMSSVFCTVTLSFERYVRICYICQMKESQHHITEDNFKYFLAAVVIVPILFYSPKFFELRWEQDKVFYNVTINCNDVLVSTVQEVGERSHGNFSTYNLTKFSDDLLDCFPHLDYKRQKPWFEGDGSIEGTFESRNSSPWAKDPTFLKTLFSDSHTIVANRSRMVQELTPTRLRRNPYYYKIYCVIINTVLASILPLLALMFLNISTVTALSRMVGNRKLVPYRTRLFSSSSKSKSKFGHLDRTQVSNGNKSVSQDTNLILNQNHNNCCPSLADGSLRPAHRQCSSGTHNKRKVTGGLTTNLDPFCTSNVKQAKGGGGGGAGRGLKRSSSWHSFPTNQWSNKLAPEQLSASNLSLNNKRENSQSEHPQIHRRCCTDPLRMEKIPKLLSLSNTMGPAIHSSGDKEPKTGTEERKALREGLPAKSFPLVEDAFKFRSNRPNNSSAFMAYGQSKRESKSSNQVLKVAVIEAMSSASRQYSCSHRCQRPASNPTELEGVESTNLLLVRKQSGDAPKRREQPINQIMQQQVEPGKRSPESRIIMLNPQLGEVASAADDEHAQFYRVPSDVMQEKRLARISVCIVWLFIFCHFWRIIPTVYEFLNSEDGLKLEVWPYPLVVVEYVSHTLIVLNSAVNFLIYVFL